MDIASVLKISMTVIAFCWSIYVFSSRQKTKETSQYIIESLVDEETRKITRHLTYLEKKLITPYLEDKSLVKIEDIDYCSSLVNYDVQTIHGVANLHIKGYKSNSYLINLIIVIFPYHMEKYLLDDLDAINTVEIVFTQNYALAVKVNGIDISTAKQQEDSNTDKAFTYTTISDSENRAKDESSQADDINIISTHTETETVNHYFNGRYFFPSLITFILSFSIILFSIIASEHLVNNINPLILLIVGLIVGAISLLFYLKKKINKLSEIKQYKESITIKNTSTGTVSIGEKITAKVPTYWIKYLTNYLNNNEHQIRIRQDNNYIIEIDNTFSLEKEPIYSNSNNWKQPLVFLFVSMVMIGFVILNSNNIKDDLVFTQYYFTKNNMITIDSTNPISHIDDYQVDDWITIDTIGQCEAKLINNICNNILVNANSINNISIPSPIKQLPQLPQLKTIRDNEAIEVENNYNLSFEYKTQSNSILNNSFNNSFRNNYIDMHKIYDMTKVTNLPSIVNSINDFCNIKQDIDCSYIKKTIIDFVNTSFEDIIDQSNWDRFVKNINKQGHFIIRNIDVSLFNNDIKRNISNILSNGIINTLNEIEQQQQDNNGIWVHIHYDPNQNIEENYNILSLPYVNKAKDGIELLSRVNNVIDNSNGLPFKAAGIITNISQNDQGRYIIDIDIDKIEKMTGTYLPTPVIRILLLAILSLFICMLFLQFISLYAKQKAFIKEIEKIYY